MNKRQVYETMVKPVVETKEVFIRDPYVCVVVQANIGIWTVTGVGFSKCNTKLDKFSVKTGVQIAHGRAVSDCAEGAYNRVEKATKYEPQGGILNEGEVLDILTLAMRKGGKVTIEYLDQEGNNTVRTIQPEQVTFNSAGLYVTAYCELRRAFRQFRIPRIVSVVYIEFESR